MWCSRGVDERGATGALPGAAAGRRGSDPVPPAGGSEVAATAAGRRGTDAPGAAGPVSGVAGSVAGIPRRVRDRGVARAGLRSGTCRYWRPSSCPGASGVTARGSLPGGRERVAAGRPACQRAAHVLRSAPALRVTRRLPRGSDGSYGPCGPAWTGRPGRPRRSRDAVNRRKSIYIRRFFGGQFSMSPGGQF